MKALWLAPFVCLALAGCAGKPAPEIETRFQAVPINTPVAVARTVPPELLAPLQAPLPTFISPSSPAATSALDTAGERRLRVLLHELQARNEAWAAWAATP